jgi:hypothetical protein
MKRFIPGAVLMLGAVLSAVGCSRTDDARLTALEKRIAALEAKDWAASATSSPAQPVAQSTAPLPAVSELSPRVESAPAPAIAAPPPAAPPPVLYPVTFSGEGQQASSPQLLEKALYVFKLQHVGERNFGVWLMDGSGKRIELLVNVTGSFSGSKAVRIPAKGYYLVDVSADGPWSITAGAP